QRSTGEDVFVHFSAIQENGYRTLNEGETVEYELMKGPKGFLAANVLRGSAN
ncbi:MAG: cold-shock protein, partial [Candidatus Angelobacter sp.]